MNDTMSMAEMGMRFPKPPEMSQEFGSLVEAVYNPITHDPVSREFSPNPLTDTLKRNIDAVVWRTGKQTTKATLAESLLAQFRWQGAFATAQSHILDEAWFNEMTQDNHLIAAGKVVQTANEYPEAMLAALLGRRPNQDKATVFGASDVVVSIDNSRMREYEQAHNKPKVDTHEDLLQFITRLVGPGVDQHRVKYSNPPEFLSIKPKVQVAVGEALYEPFKKRGVVYRQKDFFTFSPLTQVELMVYIYGFSGADRLMGRTAKSEISQLYGEIITDKSVTQEELERLNDTQPLEYFKKVNAGIRWESPIMRRKIWQANTAERGDSDFGRQYAQVMLALRGAAARRIPYLASASDYFLQQRVGIGNARYVNAFLAEKLQSDKRLQGRDYGSWIELKHATQFDEK